MALISVCACASGTLVLSPHDREVSRMAILPLVHSHRQRLPQFRLRRERKPDNMFSPPGNLSLRHDADHHIALSRPRMVLPIMFGSALKRRCHKP